MKILEKMLQLFNCLKSLLTFFGVILGVIFGIYKYGKREGREDYKTNNDKQTLKNFRTANEIRENNSKLTRDELIDKL